MPIEVTSTSQVSALAFNFIINTCHVVRKACTFNAFKWPPPDYLILTIAIQYIQGFLFWVTLNIIQTNPLHHAIMTASTAVVASWLSYILLANRSFRFPSRQQVGGLAFFLISETLVVIQINFLLK